jgi:hypothetical protein
MNKIDGLDDNLHKTPIRLKVVSDGLSDHKVVDVVSGRKVDGIVSVEFKMVGVDMVQSIFTVVQVDYDIGEHNVEG